VRALLVIGLLAIPANAAADRDLCPPNARYRGKAIDLDVKAADIHEVYRLLGDVGRVNIVIPDTIKARVTMRLKRVPWDQVACTVAAAHRLDISVNGNVLLVTARDPKR
jgi:type II secretory pathway component HofQ